MEMVFQQVMNEGERTKKFRRVEGFGLDIAS